MPSPIHLPQSGNDDAYFHVEMGPIPGVPPWHVQANPSRWPFPTVAAAMRFAEEHAEPGRDVRVVAPDGTWWEVT